MEVQLGELVAPGTRDPHSANSHRMYSVSEPCKAYGGVDIVLYCTGPGRSSTCMQCTVYVERRVVR